MILSKPRASEDRKNIAISVLIYISKMEEESSQPNREKAIEEVLGEIVENIELDAEALQVNAQGLKEGQIRGPTSLTVVPSQNMVVVGFDSGEVQFYFGLPDKLDAGSGFRIAEKDPVIQLAHASSWCPFSNVKVDKGSVSSVSKSLFVLKNWHNFKSIDFDGNRSYEVTK